MLAYDFEHASIDHGPVDRRPIEPIEQKRIRAR